MTDHLPIMFARGDRRGRRHAGSPRARWRASSTPNPTVVMLALGFLLMIGMVLIADGFGVHVPKGYVYTAMGLLGLCRGSQF